MLVLAWGVEETEFLGRTEETPWHHIHASKVHTRLEVVGSILERKRATNWDPNTTALALCLCLWLCSCFCLSVCLSVKMSRCEDVKLSSCQAVSLCLDLCRKSRLTMVLCLELAQPRKIRESVAMEKEQDRMADVRRKEIQNLVLLKHRLALETVQVVSSDLAPLLSHHGQVPKKVVEVLHLLLAIPFSRVEVQDERHQGSYYVREDGSPHDLHAGSMDAFCKSARCLEPSLISDSGKHGCGLDVCGHTCPVAKSSMLCCPGQTD